METLEHKVVWITGASSGLGEALAYEFAAHGAKLILSARRKGELERVKSKIDQVAVLPFDLLEMSEFSNITAEALRAYGTIDILVHCGGVAQNALALETVPETMQRIMDVDFFSYVELTRSILPHFIERRKGHIVAVSGLLAKIGIPGRSAYSAAKAALHGYFGCLRVELAKNNIGVTMLVPGALNTMLTTKALNGMGEIAGRIADSKGCPVDKAAKQAVKAVKKEKIEAYIGNTDKGRFLLWLSRIFPSRAVKMTLKKYLSQK